MFMYKLHTPASDGPTLPHHLDTPYDPGRNRLLIEPVYPGGEQEKDGVVLFGVEKQDDTFLADDPHLSTDRRVLDRYANEVSFFNYEEGRITVDTVEDLAAELPGEDRETLEELLPRIGSEPARADIFTE